jgi:hypothetical protein
MKYLFDLLRDPTVRNMDVDGGDRLRVHAQILSRKPMLRDVFTEFHHIFNRLDHRFLTASGLRIELGAGVAPIRDSFPDVLATDLMMGPGLDCMINAENMARCV